MQTKLFNDWIEPKKEFEQEAYFKKVKELQNGSKHLNNRGLRALELLVNKGYKI